MMMQEKETIYQNMKSYRRFRRNRDSSPEGSESTDYSNNSDQITPGIRIHDLDNDDCDTYRSLLERERYLGHLAQQLLEQDLINLTVDTEGRLWSDKVQSNGITEIHATSDVKNVSECVSNPGGNQATTSAIVRRNEIFCPFCEKVLVNCLCNDDILSNGATAVRPVTLQAVSWDGPTAKQFFRPKEDVVISSNGDDRVKNVVNFSSDNSIETLPCGGTPT